MGASSSIRRELIQPIAARLRAWLPAVWIRDVSPARYEAVGAYMTRDVITADTTEALADVCARLVCHRISCVVVLEGGRPVGMFTERDAVCCLARNTPTGAPVGSLLRKRLVSIRASVTIPEALRMMRRADVRRLAVTERGGLVGVITQTNLLEALRRVNAQLAEDGDRRRYEARHDELTGLCNRRAFLEACNAEIARARRYHGMFCLVMFDIDRFKAVNDRYGHDVGDVVLRRFATLLAESCRRVDLPARFGGEEFLVLLPAAESVAGAVFAGRLRVRFAQQATTIGDHTIRTTVSAGVSTWNPELPSLEQTLKSVDVALYRAKQNGRNQVFVLERGQ